MYSISSFLDSYYGETRRLNRVSDALPGWVCVETPLVGLFNDFITVYIKFSEDNVEFSDFGTTLSNLLLAGVSPRTALHATEKILSNYAIQLVQEHDERILKVVCPAGEAIGRYHDYLAGIMRVNDLVVLAKRDTASTLKSEINDFFIKHHIMAIPSFRMKGETGLEYEYDFGISGASECILVKSFNVLTTPYVATFQFGVEDVRQDQVNSKIKAIAIIGGQKKADPTLVNVLKNRGTKCLCWTERDAINPVDFFKAG